MENAAVLNFLTSLTPTEFLKQQIQVKKLSNMDPHQLVKLFKTEAQGATKCK